MQRPSAFLLALALLLAGLSPAIASDQDTATPLPTWDRLTPAQRETLIAPLRERWNAEPESRQRLLDHASRWKAMTPEQRKRARHGMKRWESMSPEQREQMRALYQHMRQLPPAERDALRKQFRAMTPEQRREWVRRHPPTGDAGE